MPTDQTMEPELEESFVAKLRPKRKIILAVGGSVLVALVALRLFLFLTSQKPGEKIFLPVVPSPTPVITEATRPSSSYATDSAVLKIEEDLKNIDQELQGTDLKEAGLNPPVLDMEVK